jgi:hypothetical protein
MISLRLCMQTRGDRGNFVWGQAELVERFRQPTNVSEPLWKAPPVDNFPVLPGGQDLKRAYLLRVRG